MVFAREFFDLQLEFAEAASRLSGEPLEAALLDYTNLYRRFGFGRDFEPEHAGWRRYTTGLRAGTDPREWTHHFYERAPESGTAPRVAMMSSE